MGAAGRATTALQLAPKDNRSVAAESTLPSILDTASNTRFRSSISTVGILNTNLSMRASLSYVTGAHSAADDSDSDYHDHDRRGSDARDAQAAGIRRHAILQGQGQAAQACRRDGRE